MRLSWIHFALFVLPPALAQAATEGDAFFESKVRPILVERCYECHSPDKKVKGGLRLDVREGWVKGGDTGPAIAPGKPKESLLIEAVEYANRDLQMPPKQRLSAAEAAVLRDWVQMGAPDPRDGGPAAPATKKVVGLSVADGRKFWCYQPVKKPAVPAVSDPAWPRGDIDRFILAKIEAAKLQPAPPASAADLARRLYFNLIGLPPTPEQLDAFTKQAANDQPRAVAELTDSLLSTPQFGEAWGRHWLDVARFAESSGGGRTLLFKDAWRYRDYVINAFNADLPFDRFIREQLAGDLLAAATPQEQSRQLTATAFLALGPTNYEEQEKQQLRYDVIDEQLDTLGRAFLGQTIGCARCHDHKFDPIPQRDYYALAGILSSTRTLASYTENVTKWISAPLPESGRQETILKQYEAQVAALEAGLEKAKATVATLAKETTAPVAKPGEAIAATALPGIVVDDSEAKVVGMWKHSKYVRSYIGEGYLTDDNTGKGEKTITFSPAIPKTARYEVRLAYAYAPNAKRAKNIRVSILHADGEETVFVDENQPPPIDGRFIKLGTWRFEKDGAGYVLISNDKSDGFVTVDALQLLDEKDVQAAQDQAAVGEPGALTAARKEQKKLEADLAKLKKSGPRRETAMAVQDDKEIAGTRIRVRGIEKQRGEEVPRGFLQVAMTPETAPPSDHESGRRELAEWIAGAQNPLTARVFVNRVWNWLFGRGLVRTVDLFSTTGEKPSHPELLDFLASRFVEEGWSVKKLVREIVLSRTWQEAVGAPVAADPENFLYTHSNRRRLDADQLRDAVLAVSGTLDLKTGGPNIAGAGDIDANSTSAQSIEYAYVYTDTRRSVYTPAFRNKRLELFEAFDFGDANQPSGQRAVSTVAPQALFMLNHPFMLEQARLAAARVADSTAPDAEKLADAFRRALGRPPTTAEREKCLNFLSKAAKPAEAWAQVQQALFGCLDFRYLN
ncbi:MAG TPA: DUF1553 domain-containing protein [Chthoniobacteraceae bacterium]|jgi:cytochrome c553|nr:DUF1553 domain-containing protein [Chthoniobacteraceae bacterium]